MGLFLCIFNPSTLWFFNHMQVLFDVNKIFNLNSDSKDSVRCVMGEE